MARPVGVVKSKASWSEINPTPSSWSSCSVLTRSTTDRPHRSKRQTTMASISRRRAARMRWSRCGRARPPDPTSVIVTALFGFQGRGI